MNIIERLKQNKEAYGLMPEELRKAAIEIGHDNFLVYDNDDWEKSGPGKTFPPLGAYLTYRLREDYTCTHPHTREQTLKGLHACDWCDVCVEPLPTAGWVEYRIGSNGRNYNFILSNRLAEQAVCSLDVAPGIVGFGGVYQVSPCACDCEAGGVGEGWYRAMMFCDNHGPWKPTRVRFWEVKR